jgi:hypothetical protein
MIGSFMRKAMFTGGCAATAAPDAPYDLTSSGVTSSSITLNWEDATSTQNYASSYEVGISTGNNNWTSITINAPASLYTFTSLSAGTTYHFRIRGVNCFGTGMEDGEAFTQATAAGSSNIPAAPSGFTATSNFADSVSLSWTDNSASPAEDGFDIEVSTNAGSSYSSVTTTAQNATSYSHTGRVESTAYLYRIRATNTSGSSSWVTASSVTTPAAVQSFTATAASSTQINLSWTDKSGVETGFRIERSTDNSNWSLVTTTAASATSFSNTSLNASTLYYYRIRSNSYNGTNDSAWYTANATTQAGTYEITYLVIAGGGGGYGANGSKGGGGGGAGGYRTATGLTLTPTNVYTVTVGAGGAGGLTSAAGSDSSFSGTGITTITSTGGGKGDNGAGGSGGSGGGGGYGTGSGGGAGGTGTSGQGNNGGAGNGTYPGGGGGGGGASAAGAAGASGVGGNGGAGTASSITGTSVTRAGGGGGGVPYGSTETPGTGGAGGGGNAGNQNVASTAGTANTGGGGGSGAFYGGTDGGPGRSGGSGVVILRIPTANYSGTYTNATETTDGSFKVLTFNSSGSYTG